MSIFLHNVAELCQEPGRRATLWRNRGETLTTASRIGFLLSYLPGEQQETYFLVATLMAGDRKALAYFEEHHALPESVPKSLGATLDRAEFEANPEANALKRAASPDLQRAETPYERRLRRLLDARLDEDGTGEMPFLLRQAVQQVCTPDAPPRLHWTNLLRDLLYWTLPNKPTQKRWARDFYGSASVTDDTPAKGTTEEETPDHAD